MTSFHTVETATLPPAKQSHLFVACTKSTPDLSSSLILLKKWAVEANEKSQGIFFASKDFLSLPPPPIRCEEIGNPDYWNKHCQMQTIDTGRYQSFRLPDKILISAIPEVKESDNTINNVMANVGTMVTILSNRYERENIFHVCAVNLPLILMLVVIRRASLKYTHSLPEYYPWRQVEEAGIEDVGAALKHLVKCRKQMVQDLAKNDPPKVKKFTFLYREFRDRLNAIRREYDPAFIVCYSLVDSEPIILWFRKREDPGLLRYLPGFWAENWDDDDDRKSYFWPRFDHQEGVVALPQQLCNNPACKKTNGEVVDEEALVTFFDFHKNKIGDDGEVIFDTEEDEKEKAEWVELKTCSRCKKASYCSQECQRNDYRRHKIVCTSR